MKKLLAVVLMMFAMTSFSNAQTAPENGPEITFEKTTHQFGEIPYGGNGT